MISYVIVHSVQLSSVGDQAVVCTCAKISAVRKFYDFFVRVVHYQFVTLTLSRSSLKVIYHRSKFRSNNEKCW